MTSTFEYSIIQYRGDPVRQEALNIGLVVAGLDGDASIVVLDNFARRRLAAAWPDFKWRSLEIFRRDLQHALGSNHQLMLGEGVSITETSGRALGAVAALCSNEFGLTEPSRYNATSLDEAAGKLSSRFLAAQRRKPSVTRHMTRSHLREMMSGIFLRWAEEVAQNVSIEVGVDVEGRAASHHVDVLARRPGLPELILFATPITGQYAPLIRDGVPTIVQDIRGAGREADFFAVLPDVDTNDPALNEAATATRAILAKTEGLRVIEVAALEATLSAQLAATL